MALLFKHVEKRMRSYLSGLPRKSPAAEEHLEDILNLKEKIVFGSPEAILYIILIPWS